MEKAIHKYLSRYYELGRSDELSKSLTLTVTVGIYAKYDTSQYKDEIPPATLLKELESIFGVGEKEGKKIVNAWSKTINRLVYLKPYWKRFAFTLPIARKVAARTMSSELVSVQPMEGPKPSLFFLDITYSG